MPSDRLTRAQTAGYAAGSVGTGGFGTLPGLVLAYYLTDTLGVAAALAAVVVLVPKVWDVVIDPAIGARSDRELSMHGSRHRLMTLGALTLPVGFIAMFVVPSGLSSGVAALWVVAAFILATTSFSLFQVPYIAAPADLTNDYTERTRMMAWRVAVLALAILAFGAGAPAIRDALGGGRSGYLVMAVVSAVVLSLGMLATVISLRGYESVAAVADQSPSLRAELVSSITDPAPEHDPQPCDHVAEALDGLRAAGVKIGIICDVGLAPSSTLRRYLDRHDLLRRFDHCSFSDEVGCFKPDPAIYAHALAGLGGFDPTEAAHIGDLRRTDVAGAQAAGWFAVRYTGANDDPGSSADGSDQIEADAVIADHAHLLAAVGLT